MSSILEKERMPQILVTGGAGYVGSLLIPRLLSRNLKVRVLDTFMYESVGLAPCFMDPNFEIVKGSVTDATVLQDSLRDVDAVLHLAAIVGYPACKRDPELARTVNYRGAKLLSELAPKNIPIIYSSTGSVYGENTDGLCTEETPPNPLSLYGETKLQAEECFRKRAKSVILRFATAFGMSPRMRLDLLINDFVFQAMWKKYLVIYEQHYRRGFIHVRDMVDSLLFALDHLEAMEGETYNAGSEELNLTKAEIADEIKKRIDYYIHYAQIGRDEDQRNYSLSYKKLENLGFKTKVSLASGLEDLMKGISTLRIASQYSNV
jgi:nucleoside-diphosphate-sugar epimerase